MEFDCKNKDSGAKTLKEKLRFITAFIVGAPAIVSIDYDVIVPMTVGSVIFERGGDGRNRPNWARSMGCQTAFFLL